MKREIVFIYLFLFIFFRINAQTSDTDSLQNILQLHTTEDTVKVNLLTKIAYNLYTVDIDKTFFYAKESLGLSEKLNFKRGEAESLRLIGIYYTIKAIYPLALEYLQKSLKINEDLSNKIGISGCMNSLGIVYNKQRNNVMAIEYFGKALKLFEELKNYANVSYCLNNIGVIHYETGNYTKALEYYTKSLEIDEQLGNNDGAAIGLNNIGEVYMKLEEFETAIEYFQKSLKLSEEIDDKYGISYLYKDFGYVYLNTKNYAKALEYTLKSYEIALEIDYFEIQKDICLQLSEIYKKTNNYRKAYEHFVLYKELSDSIFNIENVKKITGLEFQYKYEKEKQFAKLEQEKNELVLKEEVKQQKILRNVFIAGFILMLVLVFIILSFFLQKRKSNKVLTSQKRNIENKNLQLNDQNQEIQQLNEELNSANDLLYNQKEELEITLENLKGTQSQLVQSERMASIGVLTAGVAHEINNPLNFIKLSKYAIENYINENLIEHTLHLDPLLEKLNEGVNRTAEIIKSLKSFSHTNSNHKADCNIHSIIDNCLLILQTELKNKITVEKEYSDESYIVSGNEGELHHVFINIILNAVYAIKEKGVITIRTRIEGDNSVISVSDNGEGISQENIEKVVLPFFTTKDPGEGTGLGMSIAYKSIKDHKGSIHYESKVGKGTLVTVSFPLKKN